MASARLEVAAFLEEEKPDVMIICETKWREEWGEPDIGTVNYNIWKKNRKGKKGGGIMIWTRKDLRVAKVKIKDTISEIVKVVLKTSLGEEMSYVGVYVPPPTTAWMKEEYERM